MENQISDKVNILSKHKSQIPERYMIMSPSLKYACINADFPYYYSFQNDIFQKLILRTHNYNISVDKGEFFYMKNLLLLFNEHGVMETKKENYKIHNIIICNDDKQIEFLEKIQTDLLHSTTGVIRDLDDPLIFGNLERHFPQTIIITRVNLVKLLKKINPDKILNKKCLFFYYALNPDDIGNFSFIKKFKFRIIQFYVGN